MFNKQDRRCAAVQLMLSIDPSYDNRTIASTLKMQIRTVQRLRAQLNALDDPLEVVERNLKAEETARKTQTKEFIEKVQTIIDETPKRPIRQITRDLRVSLTTVNACVKEDLKCRFNGRHKSQILTEKTKNLRLIKSVRLLNKLKHPKKPKCSGSFQTKRTSASTRCTTARTITGLPRITSTCSGWRKQSFRLRLWSLVWFQVRATSCHLTSSKSAWKLTPKCTWMSWRMWWSPGAIRWPVADLGCGSRTLRWPTNPKRTRFGFRRSATTLYPFLTGPSPPPTWTRWITSFGHTSRTSPTWPPTTPKPAWSLPSAEYSPSFRRSLWKRHAPICGSVSRRWLRLKTATLSRCKLYYVIKLAELIFSIKVLK